jgi:circadian clock protein KaiB
MKNGQDDIVRRFDDRLSDHQTAHYVLTLFVTGASDLSIRAINNVRSLCEAHLAGRYELEVVDVHRDGALMAANDVVAAPTLIKSAPLPKRMLVGDLSDTPRVLAALDIHTHAAADLASG